MKLSVIAIICLLPFIGIAQTNFDVDGKIEKLKAGDKVYLIYDANGKQVTDSSIVEDGKFVFNGNLQIPVLASLYLNKNPYVRKIEKGEVLDYARFYLEASKITIQSSDSLKKIKVTGSTSNTIYNDLRQMLKSNDDKFTALRVEFGKLPKEKQTDSATLAGIISREEKLMAEAALIHVDFANKYNNSYLSVISLAHAAAQPEAATAADKAYQRLPASLKNTELGKTIPFVVKSHSATKIGQYAPNFEQVNPEGKLISLSDFKGKYLLIDFWASWCGPCRDENPNLVAAYQKYNDQRFEILGVSLDNPGQETRWKRAIVDDKLTWSQVSDLRGWDNKASKIYGIRSIPANFLLDPSGKIIAKDLRGKELNEKLSQIFAAER